jgi:hypothetical protein
MDRKFNYNDVELVEFLIKKICKELDVPLLIINSGTEYIEVYVAMYRYQIKDLKNIKNRIKEMVLEEKEFRENLKDEEVKRQEALKKQQEEFDKLSPEGKIIVSLVITLVSVIYTYNSPPPPLQPLSFYPNNSTLLDIYNNPSYRGW